MHPLVVTLGQTEPPICNQCGGPTALDDLSPDILLDEDGGIIEVLVCPNCYPTETQYPTYQAAPRFTEEELSAIKMGLLAYQHAFPHIITPQRAEWLFSLAQRLENAYPTDLNQFIQTLNTESMNLASQ